MSLFLLHWRVGAFVDLAVRGGVQVQQTGAVFLLHGEDVAALTWLDLWGPRDKSVRKE